MKRISDKKLKEHYINEYGIQDFIPRQALDEAELFHYEKGAQVLLKDSPLNHYYLLVDGHVRISYPFENGKSMLLKFYRPFITIGDMELLKELPVHCDVETLEESHFLVIPIRTLKEICFHDPSFLKHLALSLGDKLHATISNSSYNQIYPLTNRVASYLLQHTTTGDTLTLTSSYQDIAQFLGATYRHLHRTLHELESDDIIALDGKVITIIKRAHLQDLAKNIYVPS